MIAEIHCVFDAATGLYDRCACRFLVVDAALGSVVLALVERSTIVGMVYVGFDTSSKKIETSWS